jgi:Flp pilus assembly protein TadD
MDKLTIKYATYANALPPRRVKLEKPGWAGDLRKMEDGSEPQPWHCLPFVEAATYGLELLYPYETECVVVNDNGDVRFEFDYEKEPGGILTGGEFITFFPKPPAKFYLFNTRIDLQAPPGHVLRTEPHPRAFSDETGTAPLAICGHVQSEWWSRKLFVVFKSPPPGGRNVFRKGDPYAQILFVPQRANYELERFTPDEEAARRKRENDVDATKLHIATNVWKNPTNSEFSDYYKILARAFQRDGQSGVEGAVAEGVRRHEAGLPLDKSVAEALAQGYEKIKGGNYNDAKAIYQHVLSREPGNPEALSHLGICAAVTGAPAVGLKLMQQAVQILPNAPTYHNNLGELLRMLGRFAEAEAEFRTSLRLNPRDAGIVSTLGLTLAQQGKTDEGLRLAREAVPLSPGAATPHYRLGLIYAQLKRPAEARAAFDAALGIEPGFLPAREELAKLPATQAR